jgi:hypothetical protein
MPVNLQASYCMSQWKCRDLRIARGDMATNPKITDEAAKKATGKDWAAWFALLDKAGAKKLDHKGIVAIVHKRQPTIGGWWAQMVTVSYEQARGLRALHEKPGGFEISGSKTVNVPIDALFEAFADDAKRAQWLGAALKVRKATRPKSARFDFKGGMLVSANFYAKGNSKSYVGLNHGKIKNAKDAARFKKFWAEKLEGLRAHLEA